MGTFLVELPAGDRYTLRENVDAMVVSAQDATDAKAIAKSQFTGAAGDAAWDAATVTTLTDIAAESADSMANWRFKVAVLDSTPVVDLTSVAGLGVVTAAVNAGGTGYTLLDILTVVGGTFTRAATFRVTGIAGGVVNLVSLVDPGEYTVAPSLTANAVTGGTGTGATMDLTTDNDRLSNHLASLVGLLNAQSIIANAALDMDATNPLLTVASIADALGEKEVQAQVIPPEVLDSISKPSNEPEPIPGFINAIVDEGIAAAVLTVAYALGTHVVPAVRTKFTKR